MLLIYNVFGRTVFSRYRVIIQYHIRIAYTDTQTHTHTHMIITFE